MAGAREAPQQRRSGAATAQERGPEPAWGVKRRKHALSDALRWQHTSPPAPLPALSNDPPHPLFLTCDLHKAAALSLLLSNAMPIWTRSERYPANIWSNSGQGQPMRVRIGPTLTKCWGQIRSKLVADVGYAPKTRT